MAQFPREAIAPFFWVNGKMPTSDEWKTLAAGLVRGQGIGVACFRGGFLLLAPTGVELR